MALDYQSAVAGPAKTRSDTRDSLRFLGVLLLLAVIGAAIPALMGSQLVYTLMTQAVISALLATSVGFLVRQNGLVSFGHAAFFGIASYTIALIAAQDLASIEVALVLAIIAPVLLALCMGLLFRGIAGVAFSMLSLAVAQAFFELVMKWRELANGEDGLAVNLPDRIFGVDVLFFQQPQKMFFICWILLVLVIIGLRLIVRSHFGTLTIAIRENNERASFLGYKTALPRAVVYAISAAIAALAGCLFALYNGFVAPDVLHWTLSGEALIMAIIGGTGAVWGPALGGLIFFFLKGAASDFTEHWPAIIGMTLIIVVSAAPHGLSGMLARAAARFKGKAQ